MNTYKLYNGLSAQDLYALLGYTFDVEEKFLDEEERLLQSFPQSDVNNYKIGSKKLWNSDKTTCYDVYADKKAQTFIAIEQSDERRALDINTLKFEDAGMSVYQIYEDLDSRQLQEILDYNINSPKGFFDEDDEDKRTGEFICPDLSSSKLVFKSNGPRIYEISADKKRKNFYAKEDITEQEKVNK